MMLNVKCMLLVMWCLLFVGVVFGLYRLFVVMVCVIAMCCVSCVMC